MTRTLLLALVCLLPSANLAHAASFDCAQPAGTLEATICADALLSKSDEEMDSHYQKLKTSLSGERSLALLKEQRAWLKLRSTQCRENDPACLNKLYRDRIHALRVQQENLVPFAFPDSSTLPGLRGTCGFAELTMPADLAVYASGAYSGRKLDVQIDQSGHQATQFDIVVNSPGKPVALLLGAYEPAIWNIGWTKGTKIVAVVASGYHRQAVAGLPNDTPILISTYDNRGPCGYLYVSEDNLSRLNPLSKQIFGKPVDMVHLAGGGKAVIGTPVSRNEALFTSTDTKPDDFIDKTRPLAGPAGLTDAVAKGLLRPVTRQDLEAWADRKEKASPKDSLPPVAGGDRRKTFLPASMHNGYVIVKPFQMPSGLFGGNSATFFLADGVPYPAGDLGHSTLYDFNTMTCRGVGCATR